MVVDSSFEVECRLFPSSSIFAFLQNDRQECSSKTTLVQSIHMQVSQVILQRIRLLIDAKKCNE